MAHGGRPQAMPMLSPQLNYGALDVTRKFRLFFVGAFKIDSCAYIDVVAYFSNVSVVEKHPLDQVYQYPYFGIPLKLTASLHLKIDGWETTFLLGKVYFQGRTANLGNIYIPENQT